LKYLFIILNIICYFTFYSLYDFQIVCCFRKNTFNPFPFGWIFRWYFLPCAPSNLFIVILTNLCWIILSSSRAFIFDQTSQVRKSNRKEPSWHSSFRGEKTSQWPWMGTELTWSFSRPRTQHREHQTFDSNRNRCWVLLKPIVLVD